VNEDREAKQKMLQLAGEMKYDDDYDDMNEQMSRPKKNYNNKRNEKDSSDEEDEQNREVRATPRVLQKNTRKQ
jgi:hypothetical protein